MAELSRCGGPAIGRGRAGGTATAAKERTLPAAEASVDGRARGDDAITVGGGSWEADETEVDGGSVEL